MSLVIDSAEQEQETLTLAPTREFSYHDRCDRCGFQAYYVATMEHCEGEWEIKFCMHHGDEHTPTMELQGWTVHNFTGRLFEEDRLTGSEN